MDGTTHDYTAAPAGWGFRPGKTIAEQLNHKPVLVGGGRDQVTYEMLREWLGDRTDAPTPAEIVAKWGCAQSTSSKYRRRCVTILAERCSP